MRAPPSPVSRPKLASWLFERGIKNSSAAETLGCSEQTVLNICKPFEDASRTVPRQDLLERIVGWTEGAVTAQDFYPLHLRGPQRAETAGRQEPVQ